MRHTTHRIPTPVVRRHRRTLATFTALGLVAAACGSSDEASNAEPPVENTATTTAGAPTTDSVAPTTSGIPSTTDGANGPAVSGMVSGAGEGTCTYDLLEEIDNGGLLDQLCTFDAGAPFEVETRHRFIQFEPATETPLIASAVAFRGAGDDAFTFAGVSTGPTRFLAVVPGVGDFEGTEIQVLGYVPQNSSGWAEYQWFVGDDFPAELLGDGVVATMSFECTITVVDERDAATTELAESCSYDGELAPADDERSVVNMTPETFSGPVDGIEQFSSVNDRGELRLGLVDDNGVRRFVGLLAADDGRTLRETGWGVEENGVFTGTMYLTET